MMAERKAHRLPTSVVPERYELALEPDLANWSFTGEATIFLEVRDPVQEIVLNAAELEVHSVSLRLANGKILSGGAALDAENEQATLSFGEQVAAGRQELRLRFSGILNDKLHGFYRSTYKDANGAERRLASTQFESTDARRAFPCWDEPAFKAVYQVTLIVDDKLTAISNARVRSEEILAESGKKKVVFADTIRMSTYLVAFIVGEFEASAPVKAADASLRVWSVPGKSTLPDWRWISARRRSSISAVTTTFPIPATSWIWSRSPTSPRARWRISAQSPFARRRSWSIAKKPRARSRSEWRMWWRTRTRTCGSAIW
jgi:puromycin-sensitive aminopeptidase